MDPDFATGRAELEAAQPDFKWPQFNSRAMLIFGQLQKAWTERKWDVVRPFESDAMFETHSYWIQEYKRQKLINRLADIKLEQMIPAKIQQDKYFSAITLRMVASMIDCTQTEDGKVLSGNPTASRPFTEYWTFIRGKSAQPPKPGAGPLCCPACGAPLKINMAGICEYCKAKITSGDFDWVLSSIDQDEAYTG
jgi:predicted lipid-binding transport protein (Tim44 family)